MAVRVLVIGEQVGAPPPGLPEGETGVEYVIASEPARVRGALAGTEIVFHFGPPKDALRDAWDAADELRWVHVGGVGVDWSLFPALVESDVVVTSSRGVFDVTMPEYLLALMLALAKDLPGTVRAQATRAWEHRLLQPLAGDRVVVLGAGSIARAAARLLSAVGLEVKLVGRRARDGGDVGRIAAIGELMELLPGADWLVGLLPLTAGTRGLVGADELAALPDGARVVNIGRGATFDEAALIAGLRRGRPRAAALDVFATEPLVPDHPFWSMPNVLVSPHIGGDVEDTMPAFTEAFLENLRRYLDGRPLRNVVDKRLGYVPGDA